MSERGDVCGEWATGKERANINPWADENTQYFKREKGWGKKNLRKIEEPI